MNAPSSSARTPTTLRGTAPITSARGSAAPPLVPGGGVLRVAETAVARALPNLSPQLHASILMALSMAMHFFGYEFARSSNLSMFTSKISGFDGPGAFPLAMACVSPLSVTMLLGYGR